MKEVQSVLLLEVNACVMLALLSPSNEDSEVHRGSRGCHLNLIPHSFHFLPGCHAGEVFQLRIWNIELTTDFT
jgi:hypothetical protein